MDLTNDNIAMLIDRFVVGDRSGYREQRLADHARWKQWIDPTKITALPDAELETAFREYFNAGAGRYSFNAIYRDRIIRDVSRFRKVLLFLLDESVAAKDRLDDVLGKSGKHHIEGFGKGLATSFLTDLDPRKYPTWNNKAEMGLNALGRMPKLRNNDSWGTLYMLIVKAIQDIRELRPQLNFIEIDHLLHIVSAEPDGIKAVEVLSNSGVIDIPPAIATAVEPASMEFAMEKYLEEFIEANFSKIDFGAKLQLYDEDEESSGRQYPTSIGSVDLLAIDKAKKQFVVIELKKGKTGDAVVGQVLRYMGWVHENLLPKKPDYAVRGIVVVREDDEKLRFALSQIPNVTAFLYSVTFELKPFAKKSCGRVVESSDIHYR